MTKIIVVMPAYNAEKTLLKTIKDLPRGSYDEIILVDDGSQDQTYKIAKDLGLRAFKHKKNLGYGGNQKTCYKKALERGADIVVMLHPDYQYDSCRITELVSPIAKGEKDIMFGSRIRTRKEALEGGMPKTKYTLNRIFCMIENIILGVNFSEHFSGFRAYSKDVLLTLPIKHFSDDFVFDQELMISAIVHNFKIGEVPVPVRYFSDASSIRSFKGLKFLYQTIQVLGKYLLYKNKLKYDPIFVEPNYLRQAD